MDQPEQLPEHLQQIQRHVASLCRLLSEPNLNSVLWQHQTDSHIRRIIALGDQGWWIRRSCRTDQRTKAVADLCSWATNNRFERDGDLDQVAELRDLLRVFDVEEDEARDRQSNGDVWLDRLQGVPDDAKPTTNEMGV